MVDYLKTHKRYWLTPMLTVWTVLGFMVLWAQLNPAPHVLMGG